MAPCLSAPPLRANWGLRPIDTLMGGRMWLRWGPQYCGPAGTAQEKGGGGAPSGQSCSTSPTSRRGRAGVCTAAAVPVPEDTLVVRVCTQPAMHLAQAFGSTSLHKCEYLYTRRHACVCTHTGVGVGMWRTQDLLRPVHLAPSRLHPPAPPGPGPPRQHPGRSGGCPGLGLELAPYSIL